MPVKCTASGNRLQTKKGAGQHSQRQHSAVKLVADDLKLHIVAAGNTAGLKSRLRFPEILFSQKIPGVPTERMRICG